MEEGLVAIAGAFVGLRQSTRPIEPAEGAFHDPWLWWQFEPARRSANQLDQPRPLDQRPVHQRRLRLVRPDDAREFDVATDLEERSADFCCRVSASWMSSSKRCEQPSLSRTIRPAASSKTARRVVPFTPRRRSACPEALACRRSSGVAMVLRQIARPGFSPALAAR